MTPIAPSLVPAEPAGAFIGRDASPRRPSWGAGESLGPVSVPAAVEQAGVGLVGVLAELFKVRLTGLVLMTTAVGFYVGFRGPMDYLLMLHTLIGTALVASGASALNQLIERDYDARMHRTQDRPLPSGRLQPATVLLIGVACAVFGIVYLARLVNLAACLVSASSLLCYLFVYTPLKRVTWLNTLAGAVAGALPPLIGWAGARGGLGGAGWALFAIQALWQLPHFFSIAWLYRGEYARAGFKMLPLFDPLGRRTARQALGWTLVLLPLSLCPYLFSLAGLVYLAGALLLGLAFLWTAVQFALQRNDSSARLLFFLSILYLPLLLAVMVLDKVK
ncbi:MAG TPA: heme o synthase [Candidatus Acidoferrum sp.]|nr:heme o synthase [Candidatus Acidoferrum sp.]